MAGTHFEVVSVLWVQKSLQNAQTDRCPPHPAFTDVSVQGSRQTRRAEVTARQKPHHSTTERQKGRKAERHNPKPKTKFRKPKTEKCTNAAKAATGRKGRIKGKKGRKAEGGRKGQTSALLRVELHGLHPPLLHPCDELPIVRRHSRHPRRVLRGLPRSTLNSQRSKVNGQL